MTAHLTNYYPHIDWIDETRLAPYFLLQANKI